MHITRRTLLTTAGAASLDVLANDRDVDGDPLTVTLEGNAVVGTFKCGPGASNPMPKKYLPGSCKG